MLEVKHTDWEKLAAAKCKATNDNQIGVGELSWYAYIRHSSLMSKDVFDMPLSMAY